MKRLWTLLPLLLSLSLAGGAQDRERGFHPSVPTVTFDRVWEPITPQEFTVSVKADGPATYLSRNPMKPVPEGEEKELDYTLEFTISPANQRKIFRLAEQASYFNGDFEFKAHRMADTGKKTLTYADQTRHFQTVYNYSENKAIQELTNIFLGISASIEHGRKLQFLHKYDKLGLEAELKGMEDAASNHNLVEIQVIAPTLKSIADDTSVMNIARQRAKRLLTRSEK